MAARVLMAAHADFICEPCNAKGKMPDPVTLPVMAKKCPLCGKAKGLSRIWSGYTVGVVVKNSGEALPRMSHEDVKRLDTLESAVRATQSPPRKTFEVAHGYSVKAVGLNRVGAEVGALAAATGGEQAGNIVAAQAQAGLKLGTSRADRGEVRAAPDAPVPPPSRRTIQAARWTPTPAEVSEARSAVGA